MPAVRPYWAGPGFVAGGVVFVGTAESRFVGPEAVAEEAAAFVDGAGGRGASDPPFCWESHRTNTNTPAKPARIRNKVPAWRDCWRFRSARRGSGRRRDMGRG